MISAQDVIDALEGEFAGRRSANIMYSHREDGYCCLGVMARLAGIDVEVLWRGSPRFLDDDDRTRYEDAFPWLVGEGDELNVDMLGELVEANDGMDVEDRSYAAPVEVLRGWIDEGVVS